MNRIVPCLVCNNRSYRVLWAPTFDGTAEEAPDFFLAQRKRVTHGRIVQCDKCNFVFTSPQFEASEYSTIYKKVPKDQAVESLLVRANRARFAKLAAYVRKHVPEGGAFLDFGCAQGLFLEAMGDPRGIGFEVGTPGETRLSSYRILTGNFLDLLHQEPFVEETFSFVTSFDVFEHLPDLDQYVRALRHIIKPGGSLVITIPNIDSFVARMTGKRWGMLLLEHLWYFSPTTLAGFMDPLGFRLDAVKGIPYSAPLSHLIGRISQTYRIPVLPLPHFAADWIIPIPIGLMAAVLRRR